MISTTASTDQTTRKDPNFDMSTDPNWSSAGTPPLKKVYHMFIEQHQKVILSRNIEYDISECASIGGQSKNLKLESPSSKLSIYLLCLPWKLHYCISFCS